jgi:tetrachlorobenzoquinone reductase
LDALIEMRLTAVYYGGQDANLFEFRPADGSQVPAFTAGAHVDLHLRNGMVRQYSIVNSELDRSRYLLGVKREHAGRGGSRFLHDVLRVGELLRLSTPRNNFPLVEAPHSVLIAGGIGITPIRCMVDRAERLGQSWELHYAVQRREQAMFARDLEALGPRVHLHVDAEHGGLLGLAAIVGKARRDAHLYCCGPAGMMEAFKGSTADWPAGQVHVEYFTHTPPEVPRADFVVELAKSKRRIEITAGQTILEALRAAGISAPASCEQGVCGTCQTRVLAGVPEHRDMLLSEEEKAAGDIMLICCSLSRSDVLVLDL